MASVPTIIACGRLRCGSFTSPAANDRSPQPSYAQRMLTSASPIALSATGAPVDAVRWAALAPWPDPSSIAARTRSASALNFIQVATPTMSAPTVAPRMLTAAAKAMAPADSARDAIECSIGSMPKLRRRYSPKTTAMPPRAEARIRTSSDHPKRNAASRPQPSRR